MNLTLKNWTLAVNVEGAPVLQYDNNTVAVTVTGNIPEGWTWELLLAHGEYLDVAHMDAEGDGLTVVLTAEQLTFDGYYTVQLRATQGDKVKHSSPAIFAVGHTLAGGAEFPTVTPVFSEPEAPTGGAGTVADSEATVQLTLDNWALCSGTGSAPVLRYDGGTVAIHVTGDIPAGWSWSLLLAHGDYLDVAHMDADEGGLTVVLTAEQLAFAGYYTVQLRAGQTGKAKHSTPVLLSVGDTLSGDEQWPEIPTAFTQALERAEAAITEAEAAIETAQEIESTVIEAAETAEAAAAAATDSAGAASASASAASGSADAAAESAQAAELSATVAEAAKTAAEEAQSAAESAESGAETAQGAAETAQNAAETAQSAAETAQEAAEEAQGDAEASALSAAGSAETASGSAAAAAGSASAASGSETAARAAQTAAENAQNATESARDDVTEMVDRMGNVPVVSSTGYTATGTGVTETLTKTNIKTGAETSETVPMPIANGESAGLMTPEQVEAIEELESRVGGLENQNVRLSYTASGTPTATEIRAFVLDAGYTDTTKWASIGVVVRETNHIWRYYDNTEAWTDIGLDTVQQASSTVKGIVQGSSTNGKVFVEADGTMSLNGYDALTSDIENLETEKQDALTFDDAPTAGSPNPVTSGGVKTAIDNQQTFTMQIHYTDGTTKTATIKGAVS